MLKLFPYYLLTICLAILSTANTTNAADIKVFCDGPLEPALVRMIETFHRESGHTVNFVFGLSPVLHKRVTDGEAGDLVIVQPNFIEGLVKAGKVAAGDHPIIARVSIGFMVPAGANAPTSPQPKP